VLGETPVMIHHEGTKDTKKEALVVSHAVVGAAIEVHRHLGPGGARLDAAARMDLVVARRVVVEIKAVDRVAPVHKAQLLTYLRPSCLRGEPPQGPNACTRRADPLT
jgi:PD-(D/E)XK nuclease superfamily